MAFYNAHARHTIVNALKEGKREDREEMCIMHNVTMCCFDPDRLASIARIEQTAVMPNHAPWMDHNANGDQQPTPDRPNPAAIGRPARARRRGPVFTDGPFVETKEHVGAAVI